jgi:dTDP-glucose pyrophosphorylase
MWSSWLETISSAKVSKRLANFVWTRTLPVLGVYDVGRLEDTKKYSEVHTDMEGQITSFEEKPERPIRL